MKLGNSPSQIANASMSLGVSLPESESEFVPYLPTGRYSGRVSSSEGRVQLLDRVSLIPRASTKDHHFCFASRRRFNPSGGRNLLIVKEKAMMVIMG